MTALMPERSEVAVEATDAELRSAVRRALKHAGVTFDQLAAQAAADDFASPRARMTWSAIRDLRDLADD